MSLEDLNNQAAEVAAAAPTADPASAPDASSPAAGEPVAPAPAPAPAPTQQAAPAPPPAPKFPSVDEFGWEDWDGNDFDAIPEGPRSWIQRYHERTVPGLRSEVSRAKAAEQAAIRLYNALENHEEDPRIAEYSTKISDMEKALAERDQILSQRDEAISGYQKQESERYMQEFQTKYSRQLGDEKIKGRTVRLVQETYPAADATPDVWEGWNTTMLEPHEAVEIAVYGDQAVDMALELAKEGIGSKRIIEFVKTKFAAPQRAPARPPAGTVAGARGPTKTGNPPRKPAAQPRGWSDVRSGGAHVSSIVDKILG